MALLDLVRRLVSKTEREHHANCRRLKALPKDLQQKETAEYLYELCVRHAGIFVQEETRKQESPFAGVSNAALFHEVLSVTFWLMDKNLFNGKKTLLPAVHQIYFRSFHSSDPDASRADELAKRYAVYKREWDEISGHQDEFGLAVAQAIFGPAENIRTRERVFWIIWYADDLVKFFGRVKKIWKAAEFKPAAE